MRSYPSCWNKVLTQLNLRRKRRKASKRNHYLSRRSLFEMLEERQMLSGDPLVDLSSEETIVVAGVTQESFTVFSSQPEFFLVEKEYSAEEWKFLAEELDGKLATELPSLFVVQTQHTKTGPKAILSFHPDAAGSIPISLQKVELELRENGRVLETYEIFIDIAEESFREQFLADRVEGARGEIPAITPQQAADWVVDRRTVERAAALQKFIGPLTIDQHKIISDSISQKETRRTKLTASSTDELVALAKLQFLQEDVFIDEVERGQFYGEFEKHTRALKLDRLAAVTDVELQSVAEREKSLRNTTLLLASDLQIDLKSEDTSVVQAARKLRDELVAMSSAYETAFVGLGVDREIERKILTSGDEKAVSFVETGRYVFNEQLEIDLGVEQAMVQVTRSSRIRAAASSAIFGSPAVEDGSIDEANPTVNGGSATSLHVDGTTGSLQESLIRFKLEDVTDFSDPTTLASADLQLTEIGTGVGNAEVYVWNGLFGGTTGSVTDWDESNLTWNHVDGTLDLEGNLSEFTQLGDWTAGTTTDVDVTSQVQRALLFGDANGDGDFSADGLDGDIEAFHLAVTNWDAYVAEYGPHANSPTDLLARTDGGLGDGTIDTSDISDFFRRHGFSQGDYNLDGTVQDNQDSGIDGLDWAVFNANYGLTNAKFSQGDGNFDGVVGDEDFDIWYDLRGDDNPTLKEPEIVFWVRPEDATTDIEFASQEHATLSGPTLVIEEQPDLALNRFSVEGSNLIVDYGVLGTDFSNVKVQLFKTGSPDVLLHETNVQSGSLGSHRKYIATSVLSSIVEGDSIYAKLVGTPSTGSQSNTTNDQLDFEFSTASTQIVTSLDDAGMDTLFRSKHTLRELLSTNESLGWYDTLTFENSGLFDDGPGIITLGDHDQNNQADELRIKEDLVIEGPGSHLLTFDARYQNRVFNISTGVTATLSGFTITGGGDVTTGGGIYNAGDLTLQSVAVVGNQTRYANASGSNTGGGIYSKPGSALRIFESTIDGNHARWGGGIYFTMSGSNVLEIDGSTFSNNLGLGGGSSSDGLGGGLVVNSTAGTTGDATITNSTFSGNLSKYAAGLSFRNDDTNAKLVNVTVTDNHTTDENGNLLSGGYAGGIQAWGPTGALPEVTLHNTIVAGNTAWLTSYHDIWGNVGGTVAEPSSNNIIGVWNSALGLNGGVNDNQTGTSSVPLDPQLAPLNSYGGVTHTHALLDTSSAIDAANETYAPLLDQRGFEEYDNPDFDTGIVRDIGAYEYHNSCIVNILGDVEVTGKLTLRQAINEASNAVDPTVNFQPGLEGTIELFSGTLTIDSDMTIQGLGADLISIDAKQNSRVFSIDPDITVELRDLTITGGESNTGAGILAQGDLTLERVNVVGNAATSLGGGIYVLAPPYQQRTVNITDSTIDGNSAKYGGGLYYAGPDAISTIDITGTTFANNRADVQAYSRGGGLYVDAYEGSLDLDVNNSTFSNNLASLRGGGVYLGVYYTSNDSAVFTNATIADNEIDDGGQGGGIYLDAGANSVKLNNTIVARNTNTNTNSGAADDVFGSFAASSAYNLIGDAATSGGLDDNVNNNQVGLTTAEIGLAPLGDYGGPTQTHALLLGSLAIDAGDGLIATNNNLTTEQRGVGYSRNLGEDVDVGAFEFIWLDLDPTTAGIDVTLNSDIGSPLVPIAPSAQLEGLVDQLTVTITDRTNGLDEVLSADPGSTGIEVNYSPLTGVLTLSGLATSAQYQQVLQTVSYANNSPFPDTRVRHIVFSPYQGAEAFIAATATLQPRTNSTIYLYPVDDISYKDADGNVGLSVDGQDSILFSGSLDENMANLKFVLPAGYSGDTISRATLNLYTNGYFDTSGIATGIPISQTLDVYEMNSDNWDENGQPPGLVPSSGLTQIGSILAAEGSIGTVDVTAAVSNVSDQKFSIAITDPDANEVIWTQFSSSEDPNAQYRPFLTITGNFPNKTPVALSDQFEVLAGSFLKVSADSGVLKNDYDPDGDVRLKAELVRSPSSGDLRFNSDGSFRYLPFDNALTPDSFSYRVFDGIAYSDTATVSIRPTSVTAIEIFPQYGWVSEIGIDSIPNAIESDPFSGLTNPGIDFIGWAGGDANHDCSIDDEGYGTCAFDQWEPVDLVEHQATLQYEIPDFLFDLDLSNQQVLSARLNTFGFSNTVIPSHLEDIYGDPLEKPFVQYSGDPKGIYKSLKAAPEYGVVIGGDETPPAEAEFFNPGLSYVVDSGAYDFASFDPEDTGGVYMTGALNGLLITTPQSNSITITVIGSNLAAGSIDGIPSLTVLIADLPGLPDNPGNPSPSPNTAPFFISDTDTEAIVGQEYRIDISANDWDDDELTIGVDDLPLRIQWPDGFVPQLQDFPSSTQILGSRTASMSWNPPAELVDKTVTFTRFVDDGVNPRVVDAFSVLVRQDPTNLPPTIWANPADKFVSPDEITANSNDDVDPDLIDIFLDDGEIVSFPVSTNLELGTRSEMVFVVDSSISMDFGFEWLGNSIDAIDASLQQRGFTEREYGLVSFGSTTNYHELVVNDIWGDKDSLKSALANDITLAGGDEYGHAAVVDLLQDDSLNNPQDIFFPFNAEGAEKTSAQIVLISDEDSDGSDESDLIETLLKGNTQTHFDDIVLTTIVNAQYSGQFTDDIPYGFTEHSGAWSLEENAYLAEANSGSEWAISTFNPLLQIRSFVTPDRTNPEPILLTADLQIDSLGGNAFVIFDYQNANDFKFVAAFEDANEWRIGHMEVGGIQYDETYKSPDPLEIGRTYQVKIYLGYDETEYDNLNELFTDADPSYEGSIGLQVDENVFGPSEQAATFADGDNLWDGHAGFGSLGATASFKRVAVSDGYLSYGGSLGDLIFGIGDEFLLYQFDTTVTVSPLLGYSANGASYFFAPNGGFSRGDSATGNVESSSENTLEDYIDVAFSSGGSTWNQIMLRSTVRENDPNSALIQSFSAAFSDAIAAQTAFNTGLVTLEASIATDVITDISIDPSQTGEGADFLVTFEGDGSTHDFNLNFVKNLSTVTSVPVRILAPYVVDLFASDLDGPTPLEFIWAPGYDNHGAELSSNGSTGKLIWDPPRLEPGDNPVSYTFGVTVQDGNQLVAEEAKVWTVTVQPPALNTAPNVDTYLSTESKISSSETPGAEVGRGYQVYVVANDPNDDAPRYYLADDAPAGMTIDRNSGVIRWVPSSVGSFVFSVNVTDGRVDGSTLQTFTVVVGPRTFQNFNPLIEQIPSLHWFEKDPLSLPVLVSDSNGDQPKLSISGNPRWLALQEGVLVGTPGIGDIGSVETITVQADDGNQGFDSMTFQITVVTRNVAPIFLSKPMNGGLDGNYEYKLETRDDNGDLVTYRLDVVPLGMRLEGPAEGRDGWYVVWDKQDMSIGSYRVVILADDGQEGITPQDFVIQIEEFAPPVFSSNPKRRTPAGTRYETTFDIQSPMPINNFSADVTINKHAQLVGVSLDTVNVTTVALNGGLDGYLYQGFVLEWDNPVEGFYPIEISAVNGPGATGNTSFDLEVLPVVVTNAPPEIRDNILGPFAVGKPFDFTLDIFDPNGHDIIAVQLDPDTNVPLYGDASDLTVDSQGRLSWTPKVPGDFEIVLVAQDEELAFSEKKRYQVHVADNANPEIRIVQVITSSPVEGVSFVYPFEATDASNDPLTPVLNAEAVAAGLDVVPFSDPTTDGNWALVWNNPGPVGTGVTVRIAMQDDRGGQSNTLVLPAANFVVISQEMADALVDVPIGGSSIDLPVGRPFEYRLLAGGPGNVRPEITAVSVVGTPQENLKVVSNFDFNRGVLRWTPSLADGFQGDIEGEQFQPYDVRFQITVDYPAGSITQDSTFDLNFQVVVPDDIGVPTPEISTNGPAVAKATRTYKYQPESTGGYLQVSWVLDQFPEGMGLDPLTNELTWTPEIADIGKSFDIILRAVDTVGQAATEIFTIEVVSAGPVPSIDTAFPNLWDASKAFVPFPVAANHPLGRPLDYALLDANGDALPSNSWMIDSTGLLTWDGAAPTEETHRFWVHVSEVDDPASYDEKIVEIEVVPASDNPLLEPIILDTPNNFTLSTDEVFTHQLALWDPNSIGVTYVISEGLLGDMDVDSVSGLFTWTPTAAVESHLVTIAIQDAGGALLSNATFTLTIVDNKAPIVTLPATFEPIVGTTFLYTVAAHDPDNDTLTYALENATSGVTIDSHSGQLRWEVPVDPSASATFDLLVTDEHGLTKRVPSVLIDAQDDNLAPTVNLWIKDGDGNTVKPGDTLDSALSDKYKIWFTVEDNLGHDVNEVNWLLEVVDSAGLNVAGNEKVKLFDSRGGTFSTYFTGGVNRLNSGLLFFTLTAGDADNVTLDSSSTHDNVTGNKVTRTFRYNVFDASQERHAQLLNVDRPDKVLLVDQRFNVRGIANFEILGSNPVAYAGYDLKLVSVDDPQDFVFITRNETANLSTDSVLGTIDPTLIKSGQYRLYLEVRGAADVNCGCIAGIDEQIIEIRNDSRLGNLDLSFTDLSVDLGGIPVSLVRSYSSALVGIDDAAFGGDFGPGWTLNFLQAGIEVGHSDQITTNLSEPFADRTRLLVELPDGSLHRFEFDVQAIGKTTNGPFRPVFKPDPDVTSTLALVDQDDSLLLVPNSSRQDGTFVSANNNKEFLPANFGSALVLTTQGGIRYLFDVQTGQLNAIEDVNGRRVTISHIANETTIATENTSGSASEEIVIHFDAQGRIDWIQDPEIETPTDAKIQYVYGDYAPGTGTVSLDTLENLGQVINRVGESVFYDYDNSIYLRNLTDIYDNTEVNVLQASYYNNISQVQDPPGETLSIEQKETYLGRLLDLKDASGQGAGLDFNVDLGDGRMVTRVDDGNGIKVDEVTNNRGNVLRRVQLISEDVGTPANNQYLVTVFRYNNRGLLTHQSVPFEIMGVDNRYEQDPLEPDVQRNAWAQIITYDHKDRTKTSSDALGNTTTFVYDEDDRVVETISPNGTVAHNVYDSYTGNLLESYSTDGMSTQKFNHSRLEYDNFGRVIKTYQVDGSTELLVSETSYNSAGRVEWTKGAAGLQRFFGYDLNGNQTHSWSNWTDPDEVLNVVVSVSKTIYDAEGRVKDSENYEIVRSSPTDTISTFSALQTALSGATLLSTTSTNYDTQGRVNSSVDRFGSISDSTYNITGRVVQSRSQAKNEAGDDGWIVSRTFYDLQGRVEFSADPYFVTDADYTAGVNNGSNNLFGTRTTYDSLGRVDRTERHSGVQLDLVGNVVGLPVGFVWDDGSGGTPSSTRLSFSSTVYDNLGRVEYTLSETGARTDFYYDATGRQIATLGSIVTVGIISQRLLTISTFDAAGRLTQSATSIAITETINLHPSLENLLDVEWTQRDASAQQTTFYEYDSAGRQTAVVTTAIANPDYNPGGTPGDFDTDNARIHLRSETVYDGLGRRTSSTTGIKQADPFDATTIDYSQARTTNNEYDDQGTLTAVTLPAVAHPVTGAQVRPRYEYTFDQYGNRLTIRDNIYVDPMTGDIYYDHDGTAGDFSANFDTRVTTFTYDHRGRQLTRTLPEGMSESMAYDDTPIDPLVAGADSSVGNGQLKYSESFEGKVTAYRYDNTTLGGGRLVEKRYYDSLADYNASATPVETVSYTYDEFGRQTKVEIDRDSIPGTIEQTTTNIYDDRGRLTSVATDEAVIHYEYSIATGQLIRTYTTDENNINARTDVRYVYDNLGRLSQVIAVELVDSDVNGTPVNWFNANGSTIAIDGDVTKYDYDLLGNQARVKLENGLVSKYEYDELNRLTRMINYVDTVANGVYDEGADLLRGSYEYEIDLFSKRTAATEIVNTAADNSGAVTTEIDWVYDNLGRLTREDYDYDTTSSSEAYDFIADYEFDLVGNRLEKRLDKNRDTSVDEIFAYEYDNNDRMLREEKDIQGTPTGDTTTFYDYDQTQQTSKSVYDGLQTTEPGSGATSTTTFEYNLQGRMKKTTVDEDGDGSGAAKVTSYEYADDGIRISQTTNVGTPQEETTLYVVDKNNPTGYTQVLEEGVDTDGDGKLDDGEIDKSYIIGHDVIAQAAKEGANLAIQYLMYDGHGSTRALLDDVAAIVEAAGVEKQVFAYDAYGNLIAGPGLIDQVTSALTTLLYSGEQTDASTGLQYLRARYYNAGTGSFNRLDPFAGNFEDPQSLHKYLYTHGDPVNGVDPSGQFLGLLAGTAIAVNLSLTLFSGIRSGLSASLIAQNVAYNLTIFALIAATTLASAPISVIAGVALAAAAVHGLFSLYVYWPEMDYVDLSITVAMMATYGAFGYGIRPAPGVTARTPVPEAYYRGKISIDMNNAPASSPRNAAGFPRNARWFWKQVLSEKPEWFDVENTAAIKNGRSPTVNETWVKHHPEHQSFRGDTIVHHHIDQGNIAAPLPETVHRTWTRTLHPNN